jgi:hypothetical protein
MVQDPKRHDHRSLLGYQSCRWITTVLFPVLLACGLAFESGNIQAAQSVHLLGFVETLCTDDPYCFVLMVKPEFHVVSPAKIKVRFDADTRDFASQFLL